MQVLLIDDDVELVEMLKDYLSREGFRVVAVYGGEKGIAEALSRPYRLIVLDVMLPDVNGLEVLRRIRAESEVPLLMLTAQGDDDDRIRGLELGADDYVPKPCTPRELTARIRAILRRTNALADLSDVDAPLFAGRLAVWPGRRHAEWDGRPLKLTSTEFNLLEVLVRNAGRPISRNELSEQALGRPLMRFDRNIDVHLSSLRRKLGVSRNGESCIQAVHRLGYQFIRE